MCCPATSIRVLKIRIQDDPEVSRAHTYWRLVPLCFHEKPASLLRPVAGLSEQRTHPSMQSLRKRQAGDLSSVYGSTASGMILQTYLPLDSFPPLRFASCCLIWPISVSPERFRRLLIRRHIQLADNRNEKACGGHYLQ